MKSLTEIKSVLESNKDALIKKYKIKAIGIFGSLSRNEAVEGSDIDILVEFEEPIGLDFVLLADELENLLGSKVDLVSSNSIKTRLKKFVEQDLIYV